MVFIFGSSTGECSAPYWGKGCSWLPRELPGVPPASDADLMPCWGCDRGSSPRSTRGPQRGCRRRFGQRSAP